MATSNFPSSLDTTSALPASISDTASLNSPNHADMHEVTNDAIIEIEEKLGTGDTTASAGAVLIGTGSGASAWDTTPTFVSTVTVGGVVDITDTTDSSDATGDTGALRCEGGASIAKKLYVGTDADIDGTLEADAITVDGTALNEYIADTVGAMVGSNTETNITVTYEDGDNTLDFVVGTLNQDTTGTAALATSVTVSANNSTDETVYPLFVDGATGTQGAETDTGFSYNPSSGDLTIGQLILADGSSSAPAIAFGSDTDAGVYLAADGKVGIAGHIEMNTELAQFSTGGYSTPRRLDNGETDGKQLKELVSSERFKKDIVDLPKEEAYKILNARPIKYRGIDDDSSVPLEAGLSAESLHEAGYEYAVRYDEGHWGETPRNIYYDMLVAPLIEIVKDLNNRLEALEG